MSVWVYRNLVAEREERLASHRLIALNSPKRRIDPEYLQAGREILPGMNGPDRPVRPRLPRTGYEGDSGGFVAGTGGYCL